MPSALWRCWAVGCWRGYVWSEVQSCMQPSWCHCHSLSLASVKSRLILPFYTVSQKKRHQTLSNNFTNYYPIFKIFSLKDSVVNLQQTLKIPPRLKHVATLPCEIWMSHIGIILKYVSQLMMTHRVVSQEFKVRWVTLLHIYHSLGWWKNF